MHKTQNIEVSLYGNEYKRSKFPTYRGPPFIGTQLIEVILYYVIST